MIPFIPSKDIEGFNMAHYGIISTRSAQKVIFYVERDALLSAEQEVGEPHGDFGNEHHKQKHD